jgi:hypothetical protein
MATNYTGVDLDRYNAGNKFYSLDRHLQGTGLDKPAITFNPSRSNTGIMSQYPYPYPIIPQGGGDGGGGPPPGPKVNSKFDYETDAYGLDNLTPEEKGITQAEQDLLDASKKGYQPGFKDLGGFMMRNALLGTGFINFGLGVNSFKNKQAEFDKDLANQMSELQSQQDFDKIMSSQKNINDFYSSLNDGKGSTGTKDARDNVETRESSGWENSPFAEGGRAGYRDGGNWDDPFGSEMNPTYSPSDNNNNDNSSNDPPPSYSNNESPNRFQEMEKINPAFSYANNVGRFGGMLDTTRTIEEEEPVGNIGYLDPSGNFTIGYNTDLGTVGNANLGNFNLNHTGTGGTNLSYMGAFGNDAGRFGANYGKDGLNLGASYAKDGLNLGASYAKDGLGLNLRFEKKFNNGGIVGMYR